MSKYESSLYTNVEEMAAAPAFQGDETIKDAQNRDSRV